MVLGAIPASLRLAAASDGPTGTGGKMSNAMEDIQNTTNKLLRRAALRYAEELNRYGAVLAGYGEGKKGLADVARSGLDAAVGEARGAIELGVAVAEAYYRWSADLVGIKVAEPRPSKSTPPRAKPSGAKQA
jgi:hypothetical protein